MDDHTLHHLCKTLHSADSAWQAATSTGAEDIAQLCNAIHTLQYHAQPHAKPPEPEFLSTLLTESRKRLDHLQTTLRRLRAVISGVERWRAELPNSSLSRLVDEFLIGLREDNEQKTSVVESLKESEHGGDVDADRWLAVWTESTARFGRPDASFIQAFIEAEATLHAATPASTPSKKIAERMPQDKQLSPALEMLKRRSLGGV